MVRLTYVPLETGQHCFLSRGQRPSDETFASMGLDLVRLTLAMVKRRILLPRSLTEWKLLRRELCTHGPPHSHGRTSVREISREEALTSLHEHFPGSERSGFQRRVPGEVTARPYYTQSFSGII